MNKIKTALPYLVILAAAFVFAKTVRAAEAPTVTVDLYGNVFLNGANTGRQIGDFSRDPANAALTPQIDAAVRDAAAAARARITAEISTASAAARASAEAEKNAAIAANAAELAAKTARVAALERHLVALNTYIATLRLQAAAAGVLTIAPPTAP